MITTADQLAAHLIGDYLLQSDWMAQEKVKRLLPAIVHALTYSLPFFLFRPSFAAWLVMILTHVVIDRYRLARYVVWAKNFLAPFRLKLILGRWLFLWPLNLDVRLSDNPPFRDCCETGYPRDRPAFLSVWLLIIADNILHIAINGLALKYL